MKYGWLRKKWEQLGARRAQVIGMNQRNIELVYPHNDRRDLPLADDKLIAKIHLARLGVATPEVYGVAEGLFQVRSLLEQLRTREHFVLKPANSSGGQGLMVVGERVGPGTWRKAGGDRVTSSQIQQHLASIVFGAFSKDRPDRAYVEERIHAHPVHAALWADGLCDLRVITLHGRPLLAMLRVPTEESGGVANLHQGGIGLAVDLETGKTIRASFHGRPLERHPDTGVSLLGIQQPSWDQVIETAKKAARVPLAFLGTDIVIDRSGRALVLELNARPGLEIQNVNGLGLGGVVAERAR